MKKENSIFTEDLTKYGSFLEATNEGLTRAIEDMQKQIDTRKRILKLIQKHMDTKTVSSRDLSTIAKMSCPDFHSIDTLINLVKGFGIEPTASYLKESAYEKSIVCSGKSCAECWKNHINMTAHILNTAPVDIKNFTLGPDEDDD